MADMQTWPGMVNPFGGYTPMYGQAPPPQYTGPFNFLGGSSPAVQMGAMLAQPAIQGMFGQNTFMGQFFPQQQLYDQMQAQRFQQAQMAAATAAARQDAAFLGRALDAGTAMFYGRAPTAAERQQNAAMAGQGASALPFLSQLFGPETVDSLMGRQGSAVVMAPYLHRAMRTAYDPLTGRIGLEAPTAVAMTAAIRDNLFGPGANTGDLRGLSQGQMGALAEQLQQRGLLGTPLGALSLAERRANVPAALSDRAVSRIAETLPEIQNILANDGTPTRAQLTAAERRVRETHARIKDASQELTSEAIGAMPGGTEIFSQADADRITRRLKDMTGAIKAMEGIFGSRGHTGTMQEIVTALDSLTQGGLATMSGSRIEQLVRQMDVLGQQTGIGLEGIQQLAAGITPLTDRLGLDRSFAVTTAMESAAFGAGAADVRQLGTPAWGARSQAMLVMQDQQLRSHAAAAPLANQINAVLRMRDRGLLGGMQGGTELSAYVDAIRNQRTEYSFGGRTSSLNVSQERLLQMLQRDAGVGGASATSVLMDLYGNQEFGQLYDTTDLVRRMQSREMVSQAAGPTLAAALRGQLQEGAAGVLRSSGVARNAEELRTLADELGGAMSADVLGLDAATQRDPTKRAAAVDASFKRRLRSLIRRRLPDANDATLNRIVESVVQGTGSVGESSVAALGTLATSMKNVTGGSYLGLVDTFAEDAMTAGAARRGNAAQIGQIQSALAGVGDASPLRRIADALANANENTSVMDLAKQALNIVDIGELQRRDQSGVLRQLFATADASRTMDRTDPAQAAAFNRNIRTMQALVSGGETAARWLAEAGDTLDPATREALAAAVETSAADRFSRLEQTAMQEAAAAKQDKTRQQAAEGAGDVPPAPGGEAGQDRKVKIEVHGTLTMREDGRVDVTMNGEQLLSSLLGVA